MSATMNELQALACTIPSCGWIVVNGYAATFGVAREIARSSDDLPAFGNPTSPTSAIILRDKSNVICSPGRPSSASLELCKRPERNDRLPRPPVPPRAQSNVSPSWSKSPSMVHCESAVAICSMPDLPTLPTRYTSQPQGTRRVRGAPVRPFCCALLPCVPAPALKLCEARCRSETVLHARNSTSPPLPPLPPSGGPRSTRVSRKKLAHP
mmetsp:Transcript_31042/g.51461  ORF Transcript_31042/g.51461 Transcript_31042/m.51461 type:complete len:210 (+) Transcript_31042:71-700(+)